MPRYTTTRNAKLLFIPDDGRPTLDLTPVCWDLSDLSWSYEGLRDYDDFPASVVIYGTDVVPSGEGKLRWTWDGSTEDWPVKVRGQAKIDTLRFWRRGSVEKWRYSLAVLGPPRAVAAHNAI